MSGGGNSKRGAIAGGVVGGIVAFAVVIAVIFYLRRRSRALSGGGGAAQPGEPSLPTTIKFYVRSFVPCISLVCPHMPWFSYFVHLEPR